MMDWTSFFGGVAICFAAFLIAGALRSLRGQDPPQYRRVAGAPDENLQTAETVVTKLGSENRPRLHEQQERQHAHQA